MKKTYTSFGSSYNDLVEEGRNGKLNLDRPQTLPLAKIKFAASVLQPRLFEGERAQSEDHIRELSKIIRNDEAHMLDPVVVWWSGKHWRCLDGHHRVLAYKRLAEDKKAPIVVTEVPVEVFSGPLDDAIREATRLNAKIKLNMSFDDRRERAWRLVTLNDGQTIEDIAKLTGVGQRTVSNMRATLRKLRDDRKLWIDTGFDTVPHDPLFLSWEQAINIAKGKKPEIDKGEEWVKAEAKALAGKLSRHFNTALSDKPAVTAMALRRYARQLPKMLVEEMIGLGLIEDSDLDRIQQALDERTGTEEEP